MKSTVTPIAFVFLFLGVVSAQFQSTASPVSIEQALHFRAADGTDVLVQPGIYEVEQASATTLRLKQSTDELSVVIDAKAMRHGESVDSPLALSISGERGGYVRHVILLLPGGTGLEAAGSYSGKRSRRRIKAPVSAAVLHEYVVAAQGLRMAGETEADSRGEDARLSMVQAQRTNSDFVSERDILDWRHGAAPVRTRAIRVVPTNPAGAPSETRLMLRIHFDLDSSTLSTSMREQLDALGRAMTDASWGENPIRLIGHASPTGPADHNERLSAGRAGAVRDYLVSRWNVPSRLIQVEWMGARDPVKNEDGSIDYEQSRRTELAPVL